MDELDRSRGINGERINVGDHVRVHTPNVGRFHGRTGVVTEADGKVVARVALGDGEDDLFYKHTLEVLGVEEEAIEAAAENIAAMPCLTDGHDFLYALDDVGDPILIFCSECGRQWTAVGKGRSASEIYAEAQKLDPWPSKEDDAGSSMRDWLQRRGVDPLPDDPVDPKKRPDIFRAAGDKKREWVVAPTRQRGAEQAHNLGLSPHTSVLVRPESLYGISGDSKIYVFGSAELSEDVTNMLTQLASYGADIVFRS